MSETIAATRSVPFSELRGFPDLFRSYCSDFSAVRSYYAGDFRSEEERRKIASRRAEAVDRSDALIEAVRDQQERWGLDDSTRRNLDRLADPESVAVLTGQQIGLFSGPLYTFYKAVTAIQLADRIESETGRPSVPVFWMAGEDHDFEEIREVGLIRRNDPRIVRYEPTESNGRKDESAAGEFPENGGPGGPVGRMRAGTGVADLIGRLPEEMLETEFTEGLLDQLRDAYRPERTLLEGFARFLNGLLPESGLLLVSPDDRRLKELSRPLFRREIKQPEASYDRLTAITEELEERYHGQIHPRSTNLFLMDEERRVPIDRVDGSDGRFRLGEDGRTIERSELLDLLEAEPERFSPNVALRPLMQDRLFPTAAYVGGPSEVSYFAQLKPLYDWAEVPMPLVYPRASVTVVEGKVRSVLEKYDLAETDLQREMGALFKDVLLEWMEVDLDEEFEDASRHLHQAINHLKPVAEEVDATLVPATEATRSELVKAIEHLKDKFVRAEKRKHDEIRSQLRKAQVGLYPERTLQERFLSVLYFMNKYSPDVVDRLRAAIDLDTSAHQVVDLS